VASIGNMDTGGVICGYLGLILMSGVYISIGLFASSFTQNQIVAFLIALFAGIFFHLIFDLLAGSATGLTGQVFNFLSLRTHFESISRGVVDSSDLIYFLSIIFLGLFLAEISLSKRNKAN
jgi:ABC-2 type transport system permease protein